MLKKRIHECKKKNHLCSSIKVMKKKKRSIYCILCKKKHQNDDELTDLGYNGKCINHYSG